MAVLKNKTTTSNREFWSHVEQVATEVGTWPDWMRTEQAQPKSADDNNKTRSESGRQPFPEVSHR